MALSSLPTMTGRRQSISLILPKIDKDHKEVKFINELSPPSTIPHDNDKLNVSFPSLTDENNNKRGIFKCKHVCPHWSPRSQRHDVSGFSQRPHDTKKHAMKLQDAKKSTLNLKMESNPAKIALKREKHIEISPTTKRKYTQLEQNPRYIGAKFTINESNTRVQQRQTRIKNCSILDNEVTSNKLMQGIQRQDAVDYDRSIEVGSIKKCCAWMDTWFTEDGRPKEQTNNETEDTT